MSNETPPSDLTDQKKRNKALAGEKKSVCPILAPFPRLPHWYRSTVPEVALSVCIGPDSIWLASIEVDNAYRRQGIGSTIINHLKALADSLGLPLCLNPVGETPEWQLCLEAWYRSLGFAWHGELMVYRPINLAAGLTRYKSSQSLQATRAYTLHNAYQYAPQRVPICVRESPTTARETQVYCRGAICL